MSDFLGQQVQIPGTQGVGYLRYFGPIKGKIGEFGGIELVGSIAKTRGKNSGSVDNVQYFYVKEPMTGLFLPLERLISVNPQLSSLRRRSDSSLSRKSPLQSSNGQNRHSQIRDKLTRENSPDSIRTSSLQSLQSLQSPIQNQIIEKERLESELQNIKSMYTKSQQEMIEKNAILSKLQSMVDEIEPLLEEYEKDLQEKDRKLAKQKAEFDKQREEWRSTIELMTTSQQESEIFYENKLIELQHQNESISNSNNHNPTNQDMVRDLQYSLTEKELANNQLKKQIEKLTVENEQLHRDVTKLNNENVELNEKISQLQITQSTKSILTVEDTLSRQFGSINVTDQNMDAKVIGNGNLPRATYDTSIAEIPIYTPNTKPDPSSGRSNWCGLCEREGHSSIECPFENDNEMF
ncbi:uncharacterized protein RJT21DRAFT_17757 [Scheffersomyces amazonensis]|uniref:uncharacterized protein n=1 Tax=Scheffersomyces amazonensis TaxID=1078765 RepID=UPI00315D3FA7